jgi:hypothetical protein
MNTVPARFALAKFILWNMNLSTNELERFTWERFAFVRSKVLAFIPVPPNELPDMTATPA